MLRWQIDPLKIAPTARARAPSSSVFALRPYLPEIRTSMRSPSETPQFVFLGRLTRREPGARFIAVAGRLAAVQMSAFVAMEVLERLGAGAPMHDPLAVLALTAPRA